MSAVKSGAQRGARTVSSDVTGCADCPHVHKTTLFTLCGHADSLYKVGSVEDYHMIQHMRDSFVGPCGDEMRLKPT